MKQPHACKSKLLLLVLAACLLSSVSTAPALGDEVCVEGFIMDNFCIYDTGGTLFDNPSVRTLEGPELHSFHCLLDVKPCFESGYQVLGPKDPETGMHCPGFRLESTDTVLATGRAAGRAGPCSTCSGGGDSPTKGYRATVKGILGGMGDGSDSVSGPPVLTDVRLLDEGEGCGESAIIPPLCPGAGDWEFDAPDDSSASTTVARIGAILLAASACLLL